MKFPPKSIAIIMDGNRRWAEQNNLPTISGHRQGARQLKKIVQKCSKIGIEELSVFAFSSENWQRPKIEIHKLLELIEWYLKYEIAELNSNNIIFNAIGEVDILKPSLLNFLKTAEELTNNNTGMVLNIALNYGGKADYIHAIKTINNDIEKNILKKSDINESTISSYLLSSKVKDIDLLIRTSGEKRLSNFFFWQTAYSEFYFTNTLWPDFSEEELLTAIDFFRNRERRFGSSALL